MSARSILAAVLLPTLLCLSMSYAYLSPAAPSAQPEVTELIEKKLLLGKPEMLLLGNSASHIAIDGGTVARALGVKGMYATLKDSTAPTWYAMLKHRVYARGYRPKTVIVAGPEGALTAVSPQTTHDPDYLLSIAGSSDPLIVARVGGEGIAGTLRYRASVRRSSWRRATIDLLGRRAAEILFGGLLDAASSDHIFVAVDRDPQNGLPIGEVEGDGVDRPVEETFLPLLCDLAEQYGSTLLVVRIPARIDAGKPRSARSERIADYLGSRGVRYLDTLGGELTAASYLDSYHLAGPGRRAFTRELLAEIR